METARPTPRIDPRRLLASAGGYRFAHHVIRRTRLYRVMAERYLRAQPGDRLLDVGCGPAEFLRYLPGVEYVGIDQSEPYIESARQRFGTRGRFLCQTLDATRIDELGRESFDLVLASGLVHHLDDDEALRFFELGRMALRPGGRLVTMDGCFTTEQSTLVRTLLSLDRGRFVRTRSEYLSLANRVYSGVESAMHEDLLRIPYTMVVMECTR